MSRHGRNTSAADSDDGYVLVSPTAASAAAAAATAPQMKHSAEEEEEYQLKLDMAFKAEVLGMELPPVPPPGHHLQPFIEPSKVTFWTLLFRRAENQGTLLQLYYATALMVVIPLGMMAFCYWTIFSALSDDSRMMWSAFAGVLGVNVVAIGFGIFAYYDNSGEDDDETEAIDEAEAKRVKWEQWEREQEAEQSRDDQERLQAIRDAHKAKLAGTAAPTAKVDTVEEDEPSASTKRRTRSSSRFKQTRDSALDDATAPEEAVPEQEEVTAGSRSRSTRSRSKKAE